MLFSVFFSIHGHLYHRVCYDCPFAVYQCPNDVGSYCQRHMLDSDANQDSRVPQHGAEYDYRSSLFHWHTCKFVTKKKSRKVLPVLNRTSFCLTHYLFLHSRSPCSGAYK
jgi:hypothetical protein